MPTGPPDPFETTADRMVRVAMESGEFRDLPGTGKPLAGAGKVDDDMWWVRSWIERNRVPDDQESSNRE